MDAEDNIPWGFLLPASSCISLQAPVAYVNMARPLVAREHYSCEQNGYMTAMEYGDVQWKDNCNNSRDIDVKGFWWTHYNTVGLKVWQWETAGLTKYEKLKLQLQHG